MARCEIKKVECPIEFAAQCPIKRTFDESVKLLKMIRFGVEGEYEHLQLKETLQRRSCQLETHLDSAGVGLTQGSPK